MKIRIFALNNNKAVLPTSNFRVAKLDRNSWNLISAK